MENNQRIKAQQNKRNDFRTADWVEIVEYPELVIQQSQEKCLKRLKGSGFLFALFDLTFITFIPPP